MRCLPKRRAIGGRNHHCCFNVHSLPQRNADLLKRFKLNPQDEHCLAPLNYHHRGLIYMDTLVLDMFSVKG